MFWSSTLIVSYVMSKYTKDKLATSVLQAPQSIVAKAFPVLVPPPLEAFQDMGPEIPQTP
jgi:hypothetical protein